MEFKFEFPVEVFHQSLHIKREFGNNLVCWGHDSRQKNDLLPFTSAHSNTEKRGLAVSAIYSSVKRWCEYKMFRSLCAQVKKHGRSWFPKRIDFRYSLNRCKKGKKLHIVCGEKG